MAENIDIYDANLAHLGVMERVQAHLTGQWHRAFHCWVVSADGKVLLQKRSPSSAGYPSLLDVSAAGHLEAGESVLAGAREITEELGIPVAVEELHFLGERVEVADLTNGHLNREFQSVHLLRCDVPLSGYQADPGEVVGLVWLPITDGYQLFDGSVRELTLSGYRFSADGAWEPFDMAVTTESFVPRIQRYYVTALIMAERLLAGIGPLAIS
ncbi:isopentenyldiphosphate isomerase [Kibdelosporangium banguiense]|uniref:Isopentenyldiphosphate isomerase n=1 Tax=Kibdelosporangium banguiense TaxID=1365924 RepID=A0ABS4T7C0_9PSEU|nr:NUDIX domain-containing protein [Kibdelosporangium banguiense]MBP2320322.1 isopentenyldiphosphate isomerase [Kibdelosporangium banguiense]